MIRYYKNVPLSEVYSNKSDDYEGFMDYSKKTETFCSLVTEANKIVKETLKGKKHTIVLFDYFMVIDGYTYNVNPRLIQELNPYMPA